MTAITVFRPSVRARIPAASITLVDFYVREAIRDFCRQSTIWRDWLTNIDLIPAQGDITGATQANPVVVTAVAHGRSASDVLRVASIGGMTEINDLYFTIANPATDTFELSGIDGTAYTAYTSGGVWKTRDMPEYALTPPSGSLIVKPTVVRYRRVPTADYVRLEPTAENEMDTQNMNWRSRGGSYGRATDSCASSCSNSDYDRSWRTHGAEPTYFLPDTETIQLSWRPVEAVTDGLRIKAVLQPTQSAATVPDFLYNDWQNVIRDGALGELYAMVNEPWGDIRMAGLYEGRFQDGWKEALRKVESSHTNKAHGSQGSIGAYT
jgi:hypothetical protein